VASIKQTASGRYRVRWREHPGANPKMATFDRRVDALRFATRTEAALLDGSYVDPAAGRVTLTEWWDTSAGRQLWRPATTQSAGYAWQRVAPVLGSRPVGSLRPADVTGLVGWVLAAGVAPSTVRLTLGKLRQCAKAAIVEGIVVRDFTPGVKVPDPGTSRLTIPTGADVEALLDAADEKMGLAVLLGARAGLRRGEVLGLTTDRIGWLDTAPAITVDRQGARASMGEPMSWKPPKTAASVRDVPVPGSLLIDLARRLETVGLGEDGLVVHSSGKGMTSARFDEAWRALRGRAGLHIRFSALRHFYCSTLLSAGVNVVAVARAAGHSSPALTLGVYGHVMGSDHDRIRAVLDSAVSPSCHDATEDGEASPVGQAPVRVLRSQV
jgi:integrase